MQESTQNTQETTLFGKISKWIAQKLDEKKQKQVQKIIEDFLQSYAENKDKMELQLWLSMKLKQELSISQQEAQNLSDEIIHHLKITEQKKQELKQATKIGKSTSIWLQNEIMTHATTSDETTQSEPNALQYSSQDMANENLKTYLQDIDTQINQANDEMLSTLSTKTGEISQNPNLDGFIAEQHHADTFNINAKANGSSYRAEVCHSTNKNSVDVVIKNENGKIVKRYQSKYGQNAESTKALYDKGDYRGQQKLVPSDQKAELEQAGEKVTDVIEAPDGTKSAPLSKEQAKQMQRDAQNGEFDKVYDWGNVDAKDASLGVAKNALAAGALGVGFGAAVYMGSKWLNGEKITANELVEESIKSGADFGVKAASAGALKVAAEKGLFGTLAKGYGMCVWANVAFGAIENVKIFADFARGKISWEECKDKIGQTTASITAGAIAGIKGASVGAALGAIFGPVGSAVGGFAGGVVGYIAGSEIGKAVYQGAKKVAQGVASAIKGVGSAIGNVASKVGDFISSLW
ncbi:hypothetical protein [Helicobacter sp. T3_23-1056]